MDGYDMAFQPVGSNDLDISNGNPFATYGRILIKFRHLTDNDLKEVDYRGLSALDKQELSEAMHQKMQYTLDCMDKVTLSQMTGKLEWTPIQFTEIDNILCLIYNFKRQGTGAQTHVKSYEFYIDDLFIEFILSYNLKDKDKYEHDFEQFINYLKFNQQFKQHRYKRHQTSSTQTYKSPIHNIQFTYDATEFQSEKINNAPHMLCKLRSKEDDIRSITMGVWYDYDLTGFTAHDADLIEVFQYQDKENASTPPQAGVNIKLISSCEKKWINGIPVLRTVSKQNFLQYNQSIYFIVYRFVNAGELQTLNLFLSEVDYQNKNIEQNVIKGLQLIHK